MTEEILLTGGNSRPNWESRRKSLFEEQSSPVIHSVGVFVSSIFICLQSAHEGQQDLLCKIGIIELLCQGISLNSAVPKTGSAVPNWAGYGRTGWLGGRLKGQTPGSSWKTAWEAPLTWNVLTLLSSVTCKFYSKAECRNFSWNDTLSQLHFSEIKEVGNQERRLLWALPVSSYSLGWSMVRARVKLGTWQGIDGMCAQTARAWACNPLLRAGRWRKDVREGWRHWKVRFWLWGGVTGGGWKWKGWLVRGRKVTRQWSVLIIVTAWHPNSEEEEEKKGTLSQN